MTCERIKNELDAYCDGELSAGERRTIDAHLLECADCRDLVARARAVSWALAAAPGEDPSAESLGPALARAAQPAEHRVELVRTPRLIAVGFLGAFALSIVTVILTGLAVRQPNSPPAASTDPEAVRLELNEAHTVNLVFDSRSALDDVEFTVELPRDVELRGYEGRHRLQWHAHLAAGNNVLPLELVAAGGRGGQLLARLRHEGQERTFRVRLVIAG